MSVDNKELQTHVVLGQKYAYATISLVLGLACFVNLAGMEKAVLAIIFARLALAPTPAPRLAARRAWAKTGLVLGALVLVIVPTIIVLNLERLRELLQVVIRFGEGR
jgi:hypothetical protein